MWNYWPRTSTRTEYGCGDQVFVHESRSVCLQLTSQQAFIQFRTTRASEQIVTLECFAICRCIFHLNLTHKTTSAVLCRRSIDRKVWLSVWKREWVKTIGPHFVSILEQRRATRFGFKREQRVKPLKPLTHLSVHLRETQLRSANLHNKLSRIEKTLKFIQNSVIAFVSAWYWNCKKNQNSLWN